MATPIVVNLADTRLYGQANEVLSDQLIDIFAVVADHHGSLNTNDREKRFPRKPYITKQRR